MLHCQGDRTMSTELMLDVGQANELKLAFRRAEWTPADIKKFCEGDLASKLLPVVRGCGDVVIAKHVIDMDADPFVPRGLELVSHQKQGQVEFDPQKIKLYVAKGQKNGKWMNGKKLQPEVDAQNPYNANLLDWYLVKENQKFIPADWRGKAVFFWATIYRGAHGYLCVRCVYVDDDGSCLSDYYWIDDDFADFDPAVVAGKSN